MSDPDRDTIAAIATAPGRGGVGVVRVSGPAVEAIATAILGSLPKPRLVTHRVFRAASGQPIDEGIALLFRKPASFTGEDVLELQGHGGPVVLQMLLDRVVALGARRSAAGEFSRRAFLNDKLDLVQAEAIADLIDSETQAAARSAIRSLNGVFSERVHGLLDAITQLRMYVEAAIDFPEEEIDFLADGRVQSDLLALIRRVDELLGSARTGRLLRDGIQLVIAGRPNAGKSSLLNALTGQASAIVTQVPGTTRDLLRERIDLDGLPVHVVDTAGLRDSHDIVEQEGVRRARDAIAKADHALWVYDGASDPDADGLAQAELPAGVPLTRVFNKADLAGVPPATVTSGDVTEIRLSAKTGDGVDLLRTHLKQAVAFTGSGEGEFSARQRHVDSLQRVRSGLETAFKAMQDRRAGDLVAEDLRQAQLGLSEITGEFTADDLLGEIFASFCIGK